MRHGNTRHMVWVALLLLAWGCGQKGTKLKKSVTPPDKTLFENGEEYLRKHQYTKARLAYQRLINTYPDSEFQAESHLSIGDSFYHEGGSENLLQAEDQFWRFLVLYPTHPKKADAQLKVIAINMRLIRSPGRRQKFSIRAEAEIKRFLQDFPDSEYTSIVREYLDAVQGILAQGQFRR